MLNRDHQAELLTRAGGVVLELLAQKKPIQRQCCLYGIRETDLKLLAESPPRADDTMLPLVIYQLVQELFHGKSLAIPPLSTTARLKMMFSITDSKQESLLAALGDTLKIYLSSYTQHNGFLETDTVVCKTVANTASTPDDCNGGLVITIKRHGANVKEIKIDPHTLLANAGHHNQRLVAVELYEQLSLSDLMGYKTGAAKQIDAGKTLTELLRSKGIIAPDQSVVLCTQDRNRYGYNIRIVDHDPYKHPELVDAIRDSDDSYLDTYVDYLQKLGYLKDHDLTNKAVVINQACPRNVRAELSDIVDNSRFSDTPRATAAGKVKPQAAARETGASAAPSAATAAPAQKKVGPPVAPKPKAAATKPGASAAPSAAATAAPAAKKVGPPKPNAAATEPGASAAPAEEQPSELQQAFARRAAKQAATQQPDRK